ncbi:hypothetical protein CLOM_g2906 [Closterium sp. NIES-68]|nr:hypothetical protein CLOM_g2906 [Closterium sp. NIES-68]GJP79079.1 hypothetical protein CLOP_g9324 [Closterium sp. NIES-67]
MALSCNQAAVLSSAAFSKPLFSASSVSQLNLRTCAVRGLPAVRAEAAPAAVNRPDSNVPATPVTPSGAAMADFLVTFSRTLNHAPGNGKSIAGAGRALLSRVRSGISDLGRDADVESQVRRQLRVAEAERLLLAIESDLVQIAIDESVESNSVPVQLLRMHCAQAARILRVL